MALRLSRLLAVSLATLAAFAAPGSVRPLIAQAQAASPMPSSPPGGVVVFTAPGSVQDLATSAEHKGIPPRLKFFLDARYLDRFLETKGRMVFLRYSEYAHLLAGKKEIEEKLAHEQRMAPAHDAALTAARFDVSVEEGTALVHAVFKGKLLGNGPVGEGWKALPLIGGTIAAQTFQATWPGALLALRDSLAGQNMRLPGGAGFFYVLAKGDGDGEVSMDLGVPVADDGAQRRFSLTLPDCPMMSMGITLKEPQLRVVVEPGVGAITSAGPGLMGTHVEVGLRPGRTLTVTWQKKIVATPPPSTHTPTVTVSTPPSSRPKAHPKFGVDRAMALYCIGEDSVTQVDRLEMNVSLAPVEQFKLLKDAALSVTQLEGPGIAGPPRVVDDDKALLVRLNSPFQGRTSVDSVGDKPLKEKASELNLQPLALDGADRVREGFIAITCEVPLGLEWDKAQSKGVDTIMPAQLPQELAQGLDKPVLLAFRQRTPDALLALRLTRFAAVPVPSATIVAMRAVTNLPEPLGTIIQTSIDLDVRSNASSWLKLMFPAGRPRPRLTGVMVNGRPGSQTTKDAYGYDVQLARSEGTDDAQGTVPVHFELLSTVPESGLSGTHHLELPRLGVPVARLDWTVKEPDAYLATAYSGHLAGVTPPRDFFLDRWVTAIWDWLWNLAAGLGLAGIFILALVAWGLVSVTRRIARGEALPAVPMGSIRLGWGTAGLMGLLVVVVGIASLNSTGSSVHSLLQRAPMPLAERDAMSNAQAGQDRAAEETDSLRRVEDELSNAREEEKDSGVRRFRGAMARAKAKAAYLARKQRVGFLDAKAAGPVSAAAAQAPMANMPMSKPVAVDKEEAEGTGGAVPGEAGAGGAGGGELANAEELPPPPPPVAGAVQANPVALGNIGSGTPHDLARTFLYLGDAERGPDGLSIDVRYIRRSAAWVPRTIAGLVGFGLFVLLCLATRDLVSSGAATIATLVSLLILAAVDSAYGNAAHAALTAFGVPVLVLGAARLAAGGVEWYEGEREEALAQRLREEDAARAAERAAKARATQRSAAVPAQAPDVTIKEIFPEGVEVSFVDDTGPSKADAPAKGTGESGSTGARDGLQGPAGPEGNPPSGPDTGKGGDDR